MKKISVVVPVYNVAQYLRRCMDSLLLSKEENVEFIVINDGSKDNSLEILNEYNDTRLKVYSKENEGLYKTWKYGVTLATGDYIMFVDSDDYVCEDIFSTVNEILANRDYDLIQFGYKTIYNNNETIKKINISNGSYEGSDLENIRESLIPNYVENNFPGSRWSKVFKKDILVEFLDNSIENISMYEDFSVVVPLCNTIKSLYVTNKPLYCYELRDNSISRDVRKIKSGHDDCIKICKYFDDVKELFNMSEYKINEMYFRNYMVSVNRAIEAKQFKFAKEISKDKRFTALLKKHNFKSKLGGFLLKAKMFRTYYFLSYIVKKRIVKRKES